jgi:Sigma-70, region 4
VAALPESQREVLAMVNVNGPSIEEVARATSSTVEPIKRKAHRAYERLLKFAGGSAGSTLGEQRSRDATACLVVVQQLKNLTFVGALAR